MLIRGPRIGKGKGVDQGDYNRKDFVVSYNKVKNFMIKSYSENDVYNNLKYNVWSSTPHGNQKLDLAYHDAQKIEDVEGAKCPIILFFSQ
jgi:YT521-B-like domain